MNYKIITGTLLSILVLVLVSCQNGDVEVDKPASQVEVEFEFPELSETDYGWIAAGIYQNEALGQSRYLTFWGKGEDFPSFGIGHFIWFPSGVDAPFDEMFPDMFAYVSQHVPGYLPVPEWMQELTPFEAPWVDKQTFDQAWSSTEMTELREWLEATAQLQARFIVSTFERRWRDLVLPAEQKRRLTRLLQELATSAEGLFAIIDYYNFKGLGINARERYQGEGWGLIQVLETVAQAREGDGRCDELVELFSMAAGERLALRVDLSPAERQEERWLKGWFARVNGYVAGITRTTGPGFRIKPYLQNPDKNAVTLSWFSNENRAGHVTVWPTDASSKNEGMVFESIPLLAESLNYHPAEPQKSDDCPNPEVPYLHELRITGLEVGTSYKYEVSQDEDLAEGTLKTPLGDGEPLRFIVYADSETEPESSGKHALWPGDGPLTAARIYPVDQTAGYAQNLEIIRRRRPDFVAIAGDLVQSGGEQRDWDEFWVQNAELAASTFIIPALGNHEYFGGPEALGKYETDDSEKAVKKYKTYFDLPANGSVNPKQAERYYALDYGVLTLIVIDGTDGQPHKSDADTNWRLLGEGDGGVAPDWNLGSEQYIWLQNQLQEAQQKSRFTFVMFHGAPWSSGVHAQPPGEGPGQDILSAVPLRVLTPLFIQNGVDAVFNGHDEMYEHSILSGYETTIAGEKRSHDVHFYDVGIGGDGLRGPVDNVSNPHRVFLAHADAPEIYSSDGVLQGGGKHYGHLEVNIEQNTDGQWQARLDAVYIFPLLRADGSVKGFERRLYDDSSTIISDD